MRWFWIDRFNEFVSGSHAVAVKGVSLAEEHLHDHFTGYPIMPNSLVVEGIAQTGGLLVSEVYGFSELVVLGKVAKAHFHSRVRNGETLTYRAEIEAVGDDGAMVAATAHVGDRLHAEAQLSFARMEAGDRGPFQRELFSPDHLRHWLAIVGVFEVGTRKDGSRILETDYEPFRALPN